MAILPENLEISGIQTGNKIQRIYKSVVYDSELEIKGN